MDEHTGGHDTDCDVVVVGAGIAGLYAVHRFREDGRDVVGLESASGVGGVWRHNRYPGARVDIESYDYCYYFSPELYAEWDWSARYAPQPELLAYLEHVADRFDLRRSFRFDTRMDHARWDPDSARWILDTSTGGRLRTRFLVMATGNLSRARTPEFPGLEDFGGRWVTTAHWPEDGVPLAGRRVGVFGTGASGTQAIPEIAAQASSVHVFQRSANYCVPAQNAAMDQELVAGVRAADLGEERTQLRASGGTRSTMMLADYHALTEVERVDLMERQWEIGGHGMAYVFRTQGVDQAVNDVVAEFVRAKIRERVSDPATAEKLCPTDHPIGSRRIVIENGYFEAFNADHVHLVDLREEPVERITATGLRTTAGDYDLDVLVFAMGFEVYTGAMNATDIRNEHGATPTDRWGRRPLTYLGLTTHGFPNFFFIAGPGSPATLTNVWAENEYHADWIADCVAYVEKNGYRTIEPTLEAEQRWNGVLDTISAPLLRRYVRNYMTHINEDGTAYFIPFAGGLGDYVERADAVAAHDYEGFELA